MKIPGKALVEDIEIYLKKEVQKLKKGKTPYLVDVLIGESFEQVSFVTIKKRVAKSLGIGFEFFHLKETPSFEHLAHLLKDYSNDPKVTGIIIQQPLPPQLQTDSVYTFIPHVKEIEGHKLKSPFYPPIGLAVLTVLKSIYKSPREDEYILSTIKDFPFLKKVLKTKTIVLAGRGLTGGKPIAQLLTNLRINYLNINSLTPHPEDYYQKADIIITAVGKKILTKEMLKPGVILLNVGLRKENGLFKGDYEEDEIKEVAGFYTTTPGGVGPIDVLYLYYNLIQATKMQIK